MCSQVPHIHLPPPAPTCCSVALRSASAHLLRAHPPTPRMSVCSSPTSPHSTHLLLRGPPLRLRPPPPRLLRRLTVHVTLRGGTPKGQVLCSKSLVGFRAARLGPWTSDAKRASGICTTECFTLVALGGGATEGQVFCTKGLIRFRAPRLQDMGMGMGRWMPVMYACHPRRRRGGGAEAFQPWGLRMPRDHTPTGRGWLGLGRGRRSGAPAAWVALQG